MELGLVWMYLVTMEKFTCVLGIALVLWFVFLAVYRSIIRKKNLSDKIWKVLCVVPLIACIVHWCMFSLKGLLGTSIRFYLPLYAGAILMVIWMVLVHFKKASKVSTVIVGVGTIAGVVAGIIILLILEWRVIVGNATRMNYVDSLYELSSEMQAYYSLSDWKEIDYDALNAEVLPYFEEAQKTGDEVLYYEALCRYISAFNDGHIWIVSNTENGFEVEMTAVEKMSGNDYGFSLFTIDTGETIAILVEEESEAAESGIVNGTIITKWNGVDIDEAIDDYDYELFDMEPVAANFEMVKPIYFAGMGGETLEVSFLDEEGNEQTAVINSIGSYFDRREVAIAKFFHVIVPDYDYYISLDDEEKQAYKADYKEKTKNFGYKMLSEDCGYLRINSEMVDTFDDVMAEITNDYPKLRNLVDSELEDLKSQGMERLVIDIRNNGGGYMSIVTAIVSLFTDESIDIGGNAAYLGGQRKKCSNDIVQPNGKWADLPIVVITNAQCGSSGDGLTYALSQCKNVTVIGMTESHGIFQSVGGSCYMTNGDFVICYPCFSCVDSNGSVAIDAGADRIGRIPLDVKIPVTREAAIKMFEDGEYDYELEYAMNLFE